MDTWCGPSTEWTVLGHKEQSSDKGLYVDELEVTVPVKEAMLFKSVYKKCPEHRFAQQNYRGSQGLEAGVGNDYSRAQGFLWGEGS